MTKATRWMLAVMSASTVASSWAIEFAHEPMSVQTAGAPPNMMLIIDDSGSMGSSYSGDDMFYAPGFDDENIYECAAGANVLEPATGSIVFANVSLNGIHAGKPFFHYGTASSNTAYGWGMSGNSSEIVNDEITLTNRCFNPYKEYQVKLRAYTNVELSSETYKNVTVPDEFAHCLFKLDNSNALYVPAVLDYNDADYRTCTWKGRQYYAGYNNWGSFSSISNSKLCYSGGLSNDEQFLRVSRTNSNYCYKADDDDKDDWDRWSDDSRWTFTMKEVDDPSTAYLSANNNSSTNPARTVSGNFLNWYFSNTQAQVSDATLGGGYTGFNADASNWSSTATLANNFNINDRNTNRDNTGEYKGYKPGVHHKYERIFVARDVAKNLIRKLSDINVALSSFHTEGNGDHPKGDGFIMHGFVPMYSEEVINGLSNVGGATSPRAIAQKADADNRVSLIRAIHGITEGGGTPTASTMTKAARYFLGNNNQNNDVDFYNAQDALSVKNTIASGGTAKRASSSTKVNVIFDQAPVTSDGVRISSSSIITEDLYCAKNVMAVLTDGDPSGDDSSALVKVYDDNGTAGVDYTPNDGQARKDNISDYYGGDDSYMIRVAGALNDHDFIPGPVGSKFEGGDPINIESYFIAFGDQSIVNKTIFQAAGDAGGGDSNTHDHSFKATDGSSLIKAFDQIVNDLPSRNISITAVAVSSVAELRADSFAFQATFNSEYWSSTIKAFQINTDGEFVDPNNSSNSSNESKTIPPLWDALNVINQQFLINSTNTASRAANRKVYTWNNKGVEFKNYADLSSDMQADLNALSVKTTGTNSDLINYLRGDTRHEENSQFVSGSNKEYRSRGEYQYNNAKTTITGVTSISTGNTHNGGLLGDIVNSSPVFVGKAVRPWNDQQYGTVGKRYSSFIKEMEFRPSVVYAGANDGMMHAITLNDVAGFRAGQEVFAYIPNILASTDDDGLHSLAIGEEDFEHQFFVDSTATVSDVFVDFSGQATPSPEWRTIMVGGLRAGGKGLYALDITCPVNGLPSNSTCTDEAGFPGPSNKHILSEFVGDDDMGRSFGEPIIGKVNIPDSSGTNGNGDGRWAAIVSNGYDSKNDRAALYIIFLDAFARNSWVAGTDYIVLKPSDAQGNSSENGLSSATAMDINKDGIIDRVYAGDLQGNMWAFNIQAAATTADVQAKWTVKRLFTTAGSSQPITTPPMLARDPGVAASNPNLMVVFGTGKYLERVDLTSTTVQAIYAVHDRGTQSTNLTATDLASRWFSEHDISGVKNRKIHGSAVNWRTQFGWTVNLASQANAVIHKDEKLGERLVYRPFIAGKMFVFNSLTPTTDACNGGTEGWTMLIDWTSGLAPPFASYDTNGNGVDSSDEGFVGFLNDEAGSQLGRIGDNIIGSKGGDSEIIPAVFGSFVDGRRLGWEEKYKGMSY